MRNLLAASKRAREIEAMHNGMSYDPNQGSLDRSLGGSFCSDEGSFKLLAHKRKGQRIHSRPQPPSVLEAAGEAPSTSHPTSSEQTTPDESVLGGPAGSGWPPELPATNPNYEPELWRELREALASARADRKPSD